MLRYSGLPGRCKIMDDEMKELRRIWDSLESQLAGINDQQREYTIVNNNKDRKILGKVVISTESDEDEILEELMDNTPEIFSEDETKEYSVSGDGRDGTIYIQELSDTGPNIPIAEMTTDEDLEDFDQFMENVLDIERTQYLSGRDGWTTKEYTIVTGTGGPHVEFTTGYSLHVYWGGKQIEMTTYNDSARATIDRIEDYLNEIYTE